MPSSIIPPVLTGLLLALTLVMPIGCADDGPGDDDHLPPATGDEVGEPEPEVCKSSCQECADLMKDAYACMAYDKSFDESEDPVTTFDCIVCDNDGPGSAVHTCGTQANLKSIYYTDMEAQLVPCDEPVPAPKCTDWHPNRQVHPMRADVWNVERSLINALVADPSQLIGCDDARVRRSNGSYRVASVDTDDLLGRLGLMNDDVIRSINGYAMSGPFDAALAFFELWPDTRVFTVSVFRPGIGVLTFTYNLV